MKTMNTKEQKELIEKGYLRANIIFEIIGKPKEHIEKTLKSYIENIKQDEELTIVNEEYENAEEMEDGVFGVVAETEMLLPSLEKLNWLCINFTPASIEILEPNKKTITAKEIMDWTNDLLSRLHEIGMIQKNTQGQQDVLIKNFNAMTRNAIILSLNATNEIEEIAKKVGMNKEHTEPFLEALIKEGKIKKEQNKYYLKE